MKFRRYSGKAIILSRKNFSEADRILVLYTKENGKLSFIAKGIRKPKSRKRGALEVFSYVKFSAYKGKSLDVLTEVDIINAYPGIRADLKKVALAYYFMEVIQKTTKDGEENSDLFDLTFKYLSALEERESGLKKIKKNFTFQALVLLGYWPKDKEMGDEQSALEEVTERKMTSIRVGKKILH